MTNVPLSQVVPFWSTLWAGYRVSIRDGGTILGLGVLPWSTTMLFLVVARLFFEAAAVEPLHPLRIAEDLLDYYMSTCFSLAVLRYRLQTEKRSGWRRSVQVSGAEWHLLFFSLAVGAVGRPIDLIGEENVGLGVLYGLLAIGVVLSLVAAFSLAWPLAAAGDGKPLVNGWRYGRGSFIWMLAMSILTLLPGLVPFAIEAAFNSEPTGNNWTDPLPILALNRTFHYFAAAISAAVFAEAYKAWKEYSAET